MKYTKICKCCGKPFETSSPQKLYCNRDHYLPCPVCGKPVKKTDNDFTRPPKCCSKECSKKLRQSKFKAKTCIVCGNEFQPKSGSQTKCEKCLKHKSKPNLEKRQCSICHEWFVPEHGNQSICKKDHYLTCPICGKQYIHNSTKPSSGCSRSCAAKASMQKKKATNRRKYGTEFATQSREVKQKTTDTNRHRYGANNPMQNKEVKSKSMKNRKTSYEKSLERAKKTWLKNFGKSNPSQNPETIDKITHTFMTRYGVKRAMSVPEFREKFEHTMIERYGVPYFVETEDYYKHSNRILNVNRKFASKLSDLGIKTEFEFPIERKQYDLKIENSNVLVEIDPTYTHNTYGNHWGSGLSESYHLEKTELAEKNGYRCVHIFDWDDLDKVASMLMPKKKVYARQCEIYMIKPQVAVQFTNRYHLQGSCRGQKFCLGLVKDDELLQVMTFGKPRFSKKYDYELLRLCTKSGISVIGGASKLFHFATKYFELQNIVSYCDRSKFDGSVYEKIGMKLARVTKPQEVWSRENQYVSANLLRARGYDQLFGTNYGIGTCNELLMLENGWLPVCDCGQKVFEFN